MNVPLVKKSLVKLPVGESALVKRPLVNLPLVKRPGIVLQASMSYVWVGMDIQKKRNPSAIAGIYRDMTIPKV